MRRSIRAARTLAGALLACAALGGCAVAHWRPHVPHFERVKPYEREHFADPIMALDRDPVASSYFDHVLESREGSRGATGSVGGGCGCN